MINEHHAAVADDSDETIVELKTANQELQTAHLDAINKLAIAAEYKNLNGNTHIIRMGCYSALLGKKLGLSDDAVTNLLYAAPMHDVGNVGISETILLKPAKLTEEEMEIMKTHTTIGARILANPRSEILKMAQLIAITHHEQWNGKGYPNRLNGKRIPLEGRIVALADTFDALTSRRPYKEPYSIEVARDIIKEAKGQHFDPDVVEAFLNNMDDIVETKKEIDKNNNCRDMNIYHYFEKKWGQKKWGQVLQ